MVAPDLESLAGESLTVEHRPDPCEPSLIVRGSREACERLTCLARAEQLPDLIVLTATHRTPEGGWCVVLGVWRA